MINKALYIGGMMALVLAMICAPIYAAEIGTDDNDTIIAEDAYLEDCIDISQEDISSFEDEVESDEESALGSVVSGSCGENVTWSLDSDSGVLTISGTGEMTSHPWGQTPTLVKSVTISQGVTSIGAEAFEGCSSLTSVTIPNSVTSIGYEAFEGCSSLTSVTIPNSVTSIDYYAFYGCSSLTSVTIPNSVISIGVNAFNGCSSLTSVTIPDSVTSIGGYTFRDCRSLTSVTIPDSITTIEDGTFYNCNLVSVTIPNNVTSIGELAFYSCPLRSVTISEGVTSIGKHAFYLNALKSVTIPNSVTTIGSGAFDDCYNLVSVTIPNSVTSIGVGAFEGVVNVHVNCTREEWYNLYWSDHSITTDANIYFSDGDRLIQQKCGDNAFFEYIEDTQTIVISGTGTINDSFGRVRDAVKVEIPSGVTSIGEEAFSYCRNLTSVTIPNSVASIGDSAFIGCRSLTSVTIPNSVASIGEEAFSDCSSLTSVTISNSVTSIGRNTFYYCSSLTSVTIPNSVTSIGWEAFSGCSSLTSVTIPNSVTSIGWRAFSGCSSLTSVTIPNSVTEMGSDVFADCQADIYFPVGGLNISYYISDLGTDKIIRYCAVESVSSENGNVSLVGKKVPNTEDGFICGSIVTINPKPDIGYAVESVSYGDDPECIITPVDGVYSFTLADKNVTITAKFCRAGSCGSGVEWKLDSAGVLTIYGNSEATKTMNDFDDYSSVPWYSLSDSIRAIMIETGVTNIGSRAFYNCCCLASVTIPDGMIAIGNYAFCGCSALKTIYVPTSVQSVGMSVIDECDSLSDVYYAGTKEQWKKIKNHSGLERTAITIHYNSYESSEAVTPINSYVDGESDKAAVDAANKGLGSKIDTVKMTGSGKKFTATIEPEATSSILTVAVGAKFKINCDNATDFVVMPSSSKVVKLSSKGDVSVKKATSGAYIVYLNSKGELSSLKIIALDVNDSKESENNSLGLTKAKKLSFTTQVGNTFNIPLYNIPLSAQFTALSGKITAITDGGYGVIGSDGYYHIKGTANAKGTIKIPFTVNGKKYTIKLSIK